MAAPIRIRWSDDTSAIATQYGRYQTLLFRQEWLLQTHDPEMVAYAISPQRSSQDLHGKPIVLITGASGNLGRSEAQALMGTYNIVGLDRKASNDGDYPVIAVDLSADDSVVSALQVFRETYGPHIASVVHLAAYFDFTGKDNPLYQSVNVEGSRRLLRALQDFEVAQFLYPSTMLVHAPCRPCELIDET
jgi:hypothetical protein